MKHILIFTVFITYLHVIGQNSLITVDEGNRINGAPSTSAVNDSLPIFTYFDVGSSGGNTNYLKVALCSDKNCLSDIDIKAVDSGSLGSGNMIVVPKDNLPLIVYGNGLRNQIKVLKCGDKSCDSNNTATTIEGVGAVNAQVHFSNDRAFPIITSLTNNNISMVICGSIDCSSNNEVIILDSLQVDDGTLSSTISKEGNPIFLFTQEEYVDYDGYTGTAEVQLKILTCEDNRCSSDNKILTLDTYSYKFELTSKVVYERTVT